MAGYPSDPESGADVMDEVAAVGEAPDAQAYADVTAGDADAFAFVVVIQKTSGLTLGIDVTYSSAARWTRHGFFIARVSQDGLVAAWNLQSQEPNCVRAGDFIFQVNEVHSNNVLMIQELKVKSELCIHILRRKLSAEMANTPPVQPPVNLPLPAGMKAEQDAGIADGAGETAAEALPASSSPSCLDQAALDAIPSTVEGLLPLLLSVSDESLAGLLCVALERRPDIRNEVFKLSDAIASGITGTLACSDGVDRAVLDDCGGSELPEAPLPASIGEPQRPTIEEVVEEATQAIADEVQNPDLDEEEVVPQNPAQVVAAAVEEAEADEAKVALESDAEHDSAAAQVEAEAGDATAAKKGQENSKEEEDDEDEDEDEEKDEDEEDDEDEEKDADKVQVESEDPTGPVSVDPTPAEASKFKK
mmetsp:Transcript_132420/g.255034  ORF Transcript_132420/g.255034 Transcript_132420/m.255034 type:complete len:419 (+) Transcript_132420:57-1313(+)